MCGEKNNKLRMFPKGWQFGREPKWWLEVVGPCLSPLRVVLTALEGGAARLAARCQIHAVWRACVQRQLLAQVSHLPEQGWSSLGPAGRMKSFDKVTNTELTSIFLLPSSPAYMRARIMLYK